MISQKEPVQLLEFDGAGEVVWSWNKADLISSLQGCLFWMDWVLGSRMTGAVA
ncbi:MAG TPA: hypothetical protein VHC44_08550 [Verrucomicrobiae bacterium]|nr:hypothetical protein [Verrucomicrobiae bacterium]